MYRSSFLKSLPEHQVQIVDFLMAFLQSRNFHNLDLPSAQKTQYVKEMIDVIALRLYFRTRIV